MKVTSKNRTSRKFYTALKYFCIVCTFLAVIALLSVCIYVIRGGIGKLSFQLVFGEYGESPSILPAICGTLILILISGSIAIPIGVFTAIYLVEYMNNKGKFVKVIRIATETLAGIPSIVYGLFGYMAFVMSRGYSLLSGGITLAIMILPVIVRSTEESLLAVPDGYREGAFALGAGKIRTIFRIILPSAASGIVTAVILAIGRIISESAVLILTVGMVVNKMPESITSPGTSLALDIYYFASHGYPNEAAATSVVLLVLVISLNLLASGVGKLIRKKTGEA